MLKYLGAIVMLFSKYPIQISVEFHDFATKKITISIYIIFTDNRYMNLKVILKCNKPVINTVHLEVSYIISHFKLDNMSFIAIQCCH